MKRFIDYFRSTGKPTSASLAKERLQIIIAHERSGNNHEDFLAPMQKELVDVIARYLRLDVAVVREQVKIDLAREGEHSVLELNITIPSREVEPA